MRIANTCSPALETMHFQRWAVSCIARLEMDWGCDVCLDRRVAAFRLRSGRWRAWQSSRGSTWKCGIRLRYWYCTRSMQSKDYNEIHEQHRSEHWLIRGRIPSLLLIHTPTTTQSTHPLLTLHFSPRDQPDPTLLLLLTQINNRNRNENQSPPLPGSKCYVLPPHHPPFSHTRLRQPASLKYKPRSPGVVVVVVEG